MAMPQMYVQVPQNGGFPPEGQPLSQQQAQPGFPQYQGQVPINGWQPAPQSQQQPQFQPHPTVPYGQQFQQPQGQPQQFMPVQQQPQVQQPQFMQPIQQAQRLQVTGQEVLDGPGVPIELRGRPMSQVMGLYNQLADSYMRTQRGQQPQQQQPQQQPVQQPAPQFGQPQQQPNGQPGQQQPTFWQNPDAAIQRAAAAAVQQAIQPMQQHVMGQAAQSAQAQVFGRTPDLQNIQAELGTILRDADPSLLSNTEFLEGAVDLARGRTVKRGMQQPQQGQQPQFGYNSPPQPQQMYYQGQGPQRAVPAQQFPQPTYSFFTEGPTPPNGFGGAGTNLSPEQMRAAQGFGMSPEQYLAWSAPAQTQRPTGWR